jgi:hypothetical protein
LSVPYALHAKTAEVVGDHTHGNLTNDGKIGAAEGRIITTSQGGNLLATAGMAAGEMLYWNGYRCYTPFFYEISHWRLKSSANMGSEWSSLRCPNN